MSVFFSETLDGDDTVLKGSLGGEFRALHKNSFTIILRGGGKVHESVYETGMNGSYLYFMDVFMFYFYVSRHFFDYTLLLFYIIKG